jgi:hypothetical protein
MKKILTLFVMLLCGWSIVSAQTQTPAFGYQLVVRSADNVLLSDTNVDLTITVMTHGDGIYTESMTSRTDDLGMLSVLVGMQVPEDFAAIDWSEVDSIRTTVNVSGYEVEYLTAVQAVPYALQAGKTKLTTDQIVAYVTKANGNVVDGISNDYATIMDALVNNVDPSGDLWQLIKNKIVNYLKSRKDKAVDITAFYLAHATPDDVGALYDAVKDNSEVIEKVMELSANYLKDNKGYAMQVIAAYLPHVDAVQDVDPIFYAVTDELDEMLADETTRDEILAEFLPRAVAFAKSHRNLAVKAAEFFLQNADDDAIEAVVNAFAGSEMANVFVYDKFFNYLDYYFQTTGAKDVILRELDNKYLKKQKCGGADDVDICTMH